MTMKTKPLIAPLISAMVTAVAVLLVTNAINDSTETLEKGEEATTAEQIRTVLKQELRADIDGKTMTYGQILSSIDTRLTTVETNQENIKDSLDKQENALTALSQD